MPQLRDLGQRLMANPIFWVAVVLSSMVGMIAFFERYLKVGPL
ncbi:MAG TPA: hypothetical protein VNO81_12230 [Candidatus Nitrosotenuis sp.]|nr:hypothetical protein [Candidatus Nitrosotenuis sp.]